MTWLAKKKKTCILKKRKYDRLRNFYELKIFLRNREQMQWRCDMFCDSLSICILVSRIYIWYPNFNIIWSFLLQLPRLKATDYLNKTHLSMFFSLHRGEHFMTFFGILAFYHTDYKEVPLLPPQDTFFIPICFF